MSASLSRRLSAFFGSTPDQGPKAAKFAVLTPGPTGFPNRAKRSEDSDTTPSKTPRVSPCKPLCAILLAKASVYPLSPVKTNVSRLCECDLKPLRRGLSHAVWDVASAVWTVIGGKQGSRRSPAKRVRWEEEAQRNEQVFAAFGGNEGYGACADEKQDKGLASEPTLCPITSARSAGS